MRKSTEVLKALLFGLLFLPITASADPAKAPECKTPSCKAWESGVGAKTGAPTKCKVEISAPTYGGQVGLEIRDANGRVLPLWGKPRVKPGVVSPGVVTYRIGCGWFEEPTAEVYLCAKGLDGVEYHSRRTRSAGELKEVLVTKRLEMCLKGDKCPKYEASTGKSP